MNSIDSMTLSYFTNRSQYEQILKRTLNHKDDLEYTKEKRFYKKRILDLNKKLFNIYTIPFIMDDLKNNRNPWKKKLFGDFDD